MRKKPETYFTKEALSNLRVNKHDGNLEILSDRGQHVLTMIHPVQKLEQPINEFEMIEFKGNVALHQHAPALYETLDLVNESLQLLKDGKLNIFDFPIDRMLQVTSNVLKRASEID